MTAIPGIPLTGVIVPRDNLDAYPVTDPLYQFGGYRVVADNTARDAIPAERRQSGMVVYSVATDIAYRLGAGLTNADWVTPPTVTFSAHTHPESDVTNLVSDLAAKAPLVSPTFTGTPAAPTASPGVNTTQLATTAFVQAAVADLINGAPGALNTLLELATALGSDPNFAATMTTALAAKAPLASPGFTGTPTVPTAANGTNTTQVASTAYVLANAVAGGGAPLASPSFTGTPTAPTAAAGANSNQLATCLFVATAVANLINSAPGALDTLKELSDALGADPNFAASMTTALAGKQPLAANLTAASALVGAADRVPYFTGAGTLALATLTSAARNLIAPVTATLQRRILNQGLSPLTDAATILTDCAAGNVFTVTLAGNRTMALPTNMLSGATYIWIITQDATGNRTLALNAGFKLPAGVTWAPSTAAGKVDILSAVCVNSTTLYVVPAIGF